VALVEKQPGITVADAAKRLGTTPNSLYQVTSRLQNAGRIRKQGRGFHPAE
jgi:transposase-like protein